jgi:hypothetical protein
MPRRRLIGPDHFGGLIVIIVGMILITPVLDERRAEGVVGGLLAGLLLVDALVAAGVRHRVVVASGGLVAVLVALASVGALADDGASPAWVFGVITLLLAGAPLVVLRRVLHHREVTLSTVAGALSAYLLVGIAFSALYRTISQADADAFSEPLTGSAAYFSFVTLTTLGYGDITARSDVARSFVMLEAVIGQVLLVTLVARFVSTLGQARTGGSPRAGDPPPSATA